MFDPNVFVWYMSGPEGVIANSQIMFWYDGIAVAYQRTTLLCQLIERFVAYSLPSA